MPSLSHVRPAAFLSKRGKRRPLRDVCEIAQGIRAPRGGARVSAFGVFVNAGISRAPVYQDTRQQRKTLSGRGTARDSNLQGSADPTCIRR